MLSSEYLTKCSDKHKVLTGYNEAFLHAPVEARVELSSVPDVIMGRNNWNGPLDGLSVSLLPFLMFFAKISI